jgi:hypothetical protein
MYLLDGFSPPAVPADRSNSILAAAMISAPAPTHSILRILLVAASLPLAPPERAAAQQGAPPIRWDRVLEQEPAWYGSAEAVRIADDVLVYQHPNGGWGKNVDMALPLTDADRASIRAEMPRLETMIDNGGTFTQLRYLARVHHATGTTGGIGNPKPISAPVRHLGRGWARALERAAEWEGVKAPATAARSFALQAPRV